MELHITPNTVDEILPLIVGRGLYAFKSVEGQIIYVGHSTDLYRRFNAHRNWIKMLVGSSHMESILLHYCSNNIEMRKLERAAIDDHTPPYNSYSKKDTQGRIVISAPSFLQFKFNAISEKTNKSMSELGAEAIMMLSEKYG